MLKAPPQQNATDTIHTLSSRLASATLLEDKRAAILGLRSFAKGFPASVASGSLRDLINCLREHGAGLNKDGEGDIDTVRSVLETLLMLFSPDASSPEASEDICFWLADEFSQRQDNITILLDFLETPDYYIRINSLQLLTAISSARPERTQQCILTAPLGTARLVSVLDDGRDAVRDAALLLLVDLTSVSQTDLQKLIAFEDAFPRIFKLMATEGGIAEGGIVLQDCLSLLANLIRHSSSNQSLFRESGCLPKVLNAVKQAGEWDQEENAYSRNNREKNVWGLLAVLRLFLEKGEMGTKTNQDAFWKMGLLQLVLDLSFNQKAPLAVRSTALKTCADTITSNPILQESFAALLVATDQEKSHLTNGASKGKDIKRTYVIEALLALLLQPAGIEHLDLRQSAAILIKAYCLGHQRIKHHFLQRAIAGFADGEDESTNVLSAMMAGPQIGSHTDPLRFVFASDILSQLLFEDDESKSLLQAVSEGNAEKGEDVVTAVQTISGHLLLSLQTDVDPRITVSYLALLIIAFFDSQVMINDCLTEGSALLGSLFDMASKCRDTQVTADDNRALLPGLCAALVGTIYEFSTKDSPIPRRSLQPLILEKLGRQRYFEALMSLRQHPIVRDFEINIHAGGGVDPSLMILDHTFVDLFKDEYGRLRRAIEKDPGIEVVSAGTAGVDRDVLDDLRSQIATKDDSIQQLEQGSLMLRQTTDQAVAEHRKELQSLQASQRTMEGEVERIKRINENLQREHEAEVNRLKEDMSNEMERLQIASKSATDTIKQQHERDMDRVKGQHGASLASERSLWESKVKKATEQGIFEAQKQVAELNQTIQQRDNDLVVTKQDLKTAKSEVEKGQDELESYKRKTAVTEEELKKLKDLQSNLQQVNTKAMARVKTLEEESKRAESRNITLVDERDKVTAERDDAQAKLHDLQEEISSLKLELQAERKGFAEMEQELDKIKKASSDHGSQSAQAKQIADGLKKELDATKKSNADLEKELDKTKKAASQKTAGQKGASNDNKRVKELEAEVEKQKSEASSQAEEAKKAKTELDDLLIVMSDIEAKRDEYRERLKKAGEQVSDDEDEDEEEDEAGEENEGGNDDDVD